MGGLRGCLTTLVLGAIVLALLGWFALPPAAAWAVGAALTASGFQGTGTQVTVSASPPFELLTGHADTVRIQSRNVNFQGLRADAMAVTATTVDLFGRAATAIHGTFTGVTFAGAGSIDLTAPGMTVAGSSAATTATVVLDPAPVEHAISAAIVTATGVAPTSVTLAAPDTVTVTVAGHKLSGTLVPTPDGGIGVKPISSGLPAIEVLTPDPGGHFRVQGIVVGAQGVTITASVTLVPSGS